MDRPGVRQVPEGSGEQGKMEKTGCKIIGGASTTLAVKELLMIVDDIMNNKDRFGLIDVTESFAYIIALYRPPVDYVSLVLLYLHFLAAVPDMAAPKETKKQTGWQSWVQDRNEKKTLSLVQRGQLSSSLCKERHTHKTATTDCQG